MCQFGWVSYEFFCLKDEVCMMLLTAFMQDIDLARSRRHGGWGFMSFIQTGLNLSCISVNNGYKGWTSLRHYCWMYRRRVSAPSYKHVDRLGFCSWSKGKIFGRNEKLSPPLPPFGEKGEALQPERWEMIGLSLLPHHLASLQRQSLVGEPKY